MIFPQVPELLIEKDTRGIARELLHLQFPAEGEVEQPPRKVAVEYLRLAAERG